MSTRVWLQRLSTLLTVAALLLMAGPLKAQSPAPLPQPDLPIEGKINAIAHQADGGVIIGGHISQVDGVTRDHIARLRPDGTLDPDWKPSINDTVLTLAVASDGAIYVGGYFTEIDNVERNRIAKLNADGTLVADWNPSASAGVEILALDGDALYAGGQFQSIDGKSRRRIAKLATSDGAVDDSWDPSADLSVYALAVDDNGAVYVGGNFTNIGGQSRDRLAKFGADGTLDPNWTPSANDLVRVLTIDSGADAVYAGGQFTEVNGEARVRLAKLALDDGTLDANWTPSEADTPSVQVFALAVDGGSIYAGGTHKLVRLDGDDGSLDPDWDPSPSHSGGRQVQITTLTFNNDNSAIYVGGTFIGIGGESRTNLAALPLATSAEPGETSATPIPTLSHWTLLMLSGLLLLLALGQARSLRKQG